MTKHNYFIKDSSSKFESFREKKWHFDLYLTFNGPLILEFFTIIFQIKKKIKPDILMHHLLHYDW